MAEDYDVGSSSITFSLLVDGGGVATVDVESSCDVVVKTICSTSLLLNQPLNFESVDKYTVVLLATDSDGLQGMKPIVMQITDVGESPTDIVWSAPVLSVTENAVGDLLGRFSTADEDGEDTHSFSLEKDTLGALQVSADGELSLTQEAAVDYESSSSFTLTLKVKDSSDFTFTKEFSGVVVNVNEQPTRLSLSQNKIAERSLSNTVIGQLACDDPDNSGVPDDSPDRQTFSYTLLDDAQGKFDIQDGELRLTDIGAQCTSVKCAIDFETEDVHTVKVSVTDTGSPPQTNVFSLDIDVTDTNDPPVIMPMNVSQIPENMAIGALVTTLTVQDQDVAQTLTLTVVGQGSEIFEFEGHKLKVKGAIDFEETETLTVEMTVMDDGQPPLSSNAAFVLRVVDVNEAPMSLTLEPLRGGTHPDFPPDSPRVGETMTPGTVVGQVVVSDPDRQEDLNVVVRGNALSVGSPSCLTLTTVTRCVAPVYLQKTLDFEKQTTFSETLTAIDKSGLKLEKTFEFEVLDENDPPTAILVNGKDISVVEVAENSQGMIVATLSVQDEDAGQSCSYSVTGRVEFYITGNNLTLTSAANLDFESRSEVEINLRATDNGTPALSTDKVLTIIVTDVNEAPSHVSLSRNQVAEDAEVDTEIGTLVTSDPDNSQGLIQTFSYELLQPNTGMFKIAGNMLVLAKAELDYEKQAVYYVRVKVTDSGSPALSSRFDLQVVVQNRNDAPFNLQLSASDIGEAASINTEVGTLSAEDWDFGQTLSFTVGDSSLFSVREDKLVVNGELDFEGQPEASVEVTASDNGVPSKSVSRTLTISVSDENDAPERFTLELMQSFSDFKIEEVTKEGSIIATLQSFDPDQHDQASFELTGKTSPFFSLDAAGTTCDLQGDPVYTVCSQNVLLAKHVTYRPRDDPLLIEVIATDKGQLTLKQSWEFTVKDSNDAPSDILLEPGLPVPENQKTFNVGVLKCVDKENQQTHALMLLDNWDIFRVNVLATFFGPPATNLTTMKALDAETKDEYKVNIKCVDSGTPSGSFTKTFTIKVKDMNEEPTDLSLSHSELPMTATLGHLVGFVKVSDPDNLGPDPHKQKHVCSVHGPFSDVLGIREQDNALQVIGEVPVQETFLDVELSCVEAGTPEAFVINKTVQVFIMETPDVPKALMLEVPEGQQAEVSENTAGVVVGSFIVINELTRTPIDASLTFTSVSAAGDQPEAFKVDADNNQLVLQEPVDYEATPELTVTVTATGTDADNSSIIFELTIELVVQVKDVNEPPTEVNIYGGGLLSENSPSGTEIGDLNTLDPEPGQSYSYSLLSVGAGLDPLDSSPQLMKVFRLSGPTLLVDDPQTFLDYEVNPVFSLQVQTTDTGLPPLSLTWTLRIVLQDMNDAPTDISLDNSVVSEGVAVGHEVGRLSVQDEDKQQSYRCIVDNLLDVPLAVEGGVVLVVSRLGLDYETTRTLVIQVTCVDQGRDATYLKVSKSLTINVTDANEPPYNLQLSNSVVSEEGQAGTLVGELSAVDPDSSTMTFTLDDPDSVFAVQGTATLVTSALLDYEEQDRHSVTVRVTDDGGLSSTHTFIVKVQDVNEPPRSLNLSSVEVKENSPGGTLVGLLTTFDPDNSQTFSYSFSTPSSQFIIVEDRLEVGSSARLDHESQDMYRVSITSVDSGEPPREKTVEFIISVTDVNDPLSEVVVPELVEVEENTPRQAAIADITVVDQEMDQVHQCQVLEADAPFSVSRGSGLIQLVVAGTLDHELEGEYKLTLRCSDGEFSLDTEVTVKVMDVNEPPTAILLTGAKVLPAVGGGTLGRLTALDQDKGQLHSFHTRGSHSDLITVVNDELVLLGQLPPDLVEASSVDVLLEVIDNGQPALSLSQTFTFPITSVNIETLVLPPLKLNTSQVPEDTSPGSTVAEVIPHESVEVSLTKDVNRLFRLEGNILVLTGNLSAFPLSSADVTLQARHTLTGETQSKEFTLIVVRSAACWAPGLGDCHRRARCVASDQGEHTCLCQNDYTGDGRSCTLVDDCEVQGGRQQCGSHGDCVDGVGTFTCLCRDGWSGQTCDVMPTASDACGTNACENKAICEVALALPRNYSCACARGWEGDLCGASVDDCEAQLCQAGGSCEDHHLTFTCTCPQGRVGHRCQFLAPDCGGPCGEEALCVPQGGGASICCPDGRLLILPILCVPGEPSQACQTRFLTFVEKYAANRLPNSASDLSEELPSELPGARRKRSWLVSSPGDPLFPQSDKLTGEDRQRRRAGEELRQVGVYLVRSEVTGSGLTVTVAMMDEAGVPFTRTEMLVALTETCDSIESSQQKEEMYCPSVKLLEAEGSTAARLTRRGLLELLIISCLVMLLKQAVAEGIV